MIRLIVGLPGSGKTMLATEMAEHSPASQVIDDPMAGFTFPQERTGDLIITDPHLCRDEVRVGAAKKLAKLYPGEELEWTFFENDPLACQANIQRRADGRKVDTTIKLYARIYKIPDGVTARPVWSPHMERDNKARSRKRD